jgi:hypothetical protein
VGRRNTKRHRREPVRHPIPQARLSAPPDRSRFDPDHPRLPVFEASGMAGALEKGPVEVLPLDPLAEYPSSRPKISHSAMGLLKIHLLCGSP